MRLPPAPVQLPPPLTAGERVWDVLKFFAITPYMVLGVICFGSWFTILLFGSTLLIEKIWYPPMDTELFFEFVNAPLVVCAVASTYAALRFRRRMLSFGFACAAWVFVRFFPDESHLVRFTVK